MSKSQDNTLGIFCPLFKGEKFIGNYLENILEQTIFSEVNFYILDCASPENEYEVIKDYTSKYSNIIYKRLDKGNGVYAAWNICVRWTREKFIGNWNVDDRKTPWSLEVLLDNISANHLDLVYGKTLVTQKANDRWDLCESETFYPCLEHSFDNLIKNNSPHCMPIWRRDLHDKFGYFNEQYMTASDTDMWLKACKGGAKMQFVNETVGLYYENPNGISTNKEKLQELILEVNKVRDLYRNDTNNSGNKKLSEGFSFNEENL